MVGALVASAVLGGALVGTTFANDRGDGADGGLPKIGAEYCTTFVESFATELGVTTDALAGAGLSAFSTTLDAAVAAGDLSEERAAAIREHLATANGDVCALFGHRDDGDDDEGRVHFGRGTLFAAAAEALGIDRQELFGALREHGSLEAIATDQGLDYAGVKAAILASVQATLDAAVADGTISQERAEAKLEKITRWLDEGGEIRGLGWGDRRHHGNGDDDKDDHHDREGRGGWNDHDDRNDGDRRGD